MKFEEIKKLHQKKYREEYGHFLVEGEHLVLELEKAARHHPAWRASQLFITEAHQHRDSPFETTVLSDKQMAQLSDTESPQGIMALVPMAAWQALHHSAPQQSKAVYLYEVQDPGNLGSILRTLAWFGGFRCVLSTNSVDPLNSKVIRASMGAIFHVPITQGLGMEELAGQFQQIACMEMSGASLKTADFLRSDCLVFGNEARGIPSELRAHLPATSFSIPGGGAIESLNLAAAVAMSIYELSRKSCGGRTGSP